MLKKGISPLVAVVILIAFVIGISLFLSPWFTRFFGERTKKIEEKAKKAQKAAAGASFEIEEVVDCKNLTDEIKITLDNMGTQKLSDFTGSAEFGDEGYKDLKCKKDCEPALKAGHLRTMTFNTTTYDITDKDDVTAVTISAGNIPGTRAKRKPEEPINC